MRTSSLRAGLLTLLSLLVVPLAWAASPPGDPPMLSAAASTNAFATRLYSHLSGQKPENLFFSPASLTAALTLAYGGARGQTAAEMAQVLALPANGDAAHHAQAQFLNWVRGEGKPEGRPFQLAMANALWGQRDISWRPDFLNLAKLHYAAGLRLVDFEADPEAVRREINTWVAQNTQNRIPELLVSGTIHREIRLVLTNAIYFKADWAMPFEKEATHPAAFHLVSGKKVNKPTMHQIKHFKYRETEQAQILEMPYRGDELSMVVVLPKPTSSLHAVESELDPKSFTQWTAGMKPRRVAVSLPKFTFRTSLDLGKTLASLGMPLAFTNRADFSGLTDELNLKIDKVIHQAYVAVDEKGTEAAAATAITMMPTAAPLEEDPVIFKADRPFLFYIREQKSGTVLFLGRLMEP
jgi:serpin B